MLQSVMELLLICYLLLAVVVVVVIVAPELALMFVVLGVAEANAVEVEGAMPAAIAPETEQQYENWQSSKISSSTIFRIHMIFRRSGPTQRWEQGKQ